MDVKDDLSYKTLIIRGGEKMKIIVGSGATEEKVGKEWRKEFSGGI